MGRMLRLCQKWPDSHGRDNTYWIGADVMAAGKQHADGTIVLGHDCHTLEEIEGVVRDVKVELDVLLTEARVKLK